MRKYNRESRDTSQSVQTLEVRQVTPLNENLLLRSPRLPEASRLLKQRSVGVGRF